jgi:hypothetical protein
MWQPFGVAIASVIAYGTAAKPAWRCDPSLKSCHAVGAGEACCTVESNMGWRYNVIVLGGLTLVVFFLRFFVFKFHESPKYLLARGKEAEAIEVLHRIAKYNKQPPPTLTLEMFATIDETESNEHLRTSAPQGTADATKKAVSGFGKEIARLKGIFTNKLSAIIFALLAIAYMVSISLISAHELLINLQGDYWSFNLAGAFLPIILLRNNVSSGRGSVSDTYEQYMIIYFPGIIGAILALCSIQLPLVGRKWSLVFSAICQGIAMAMYTQVSSTKAYVGLNALEYIMQTVSFPPANITISPLIKDSTLTPFCMPPRLNSSTQLTAVASAACSLVRVV